MSRGIRLVLLFAAGVVLLLLPALLLQHAETRFQARTALQDRAKAEQRLQSTLEQFRRVGSPDIFLEMRLQQIVEEITARAVADGQLPTVRKVAEAAGAVLGNPDHQDIPFTVVSLFHQASPTVTLVPLLERDAEIATILPELMRYLCACRIGGAENFENRVTLSNRFQKMFSTDLTLGLLATKFRGRVLRFMLRGRPCWFFWQSFQPVDVGPLLSTLPQERWCTENGNLTDEAFVKAMFGGIGFLMLPDGPEDTPRQVLDFFDDKEVVVALYPEDGTKPLFSRGFPGSKMAHGISEHLERQGWMTATGTAFLSKPFRVLAGTPRSLSAPIGAEARSIRIVVGWAGFLVGLFFWGWAVFADRGIAGKLQWQLLGGFFLMLLLPVSTLFWITEDLADEQLEALEQETRAELRRGIDERQRRFIAGRQGEWLSSLKTMQEPSFARLLDGAEKQWREDGGKISSASRNCLQKAMAERMEAMQVGPFRLSIFSMAISGAPGFSCEATRSGDKSSGEMAETFGMLSAPVLETINPIPERSVPPSGNTSLKRGAQEEMAGDVIRGVLISCLGPEGYYSLAYGLGNSIFVRLGVAFTQFSLIPLPSSEDPRFQVFTLYSARNSDFRHVAAALARQRGPIRYSACDYERIGTSYKPDEMDGNPLLRKASRLTRLVQSPQSLRLKLGGEEYLIETMLNFPHHQFMLLGIASEEPLRQQVERIKRLQQLLLLLSLVLTWLLAWISARDILRPVNSLVGEMNRIREGDFAARVQETRTDELGQLCGAFDRMARGLQEGKLLGRMVSSQARRALEEGIDDVAAREGRRHDVTVLYIGFGSLDEVISRGSPEQLIGVLDVQVRETCRVILAAGGDVDKVMGDKILAVFPHGADAGLSVRNALAALAGLSRSRSDGRLPLPIAGGINSGTVIAGFLGSKARQDFTIIGDPVNLAARCEGLAESLTGHPWVCTESIRKLLPVGISCDELPVTSVKGKAEAVRLYQVLV